MGSACHLPPAIRTKERCNTLISTCWSPDCKISASLNTCGYLGVMCLRFLLLLAADLLLWVWVRFHHLAGNFWRAQTIFMNLLSNTLFDLSLSLKCIFAELQLQAIYSIYFQALWNLQRCRSLTIAHSQLKVVLLFKLHRKRNRVRKNREEKQWIALSYVHSAVLPIIWGCRVLMCRITYRWNNYQL